MGQVTDQAPLVGPTKGPQITSSVSSSFGYVFTYKKVIFSFIFHARKFFIKGFAKHCRVKTEEGG